jgi:hypothetical protein
MGSIQLLVELLKYVLLVTTQKKVLICKLIVEPFEPVSVLVAILTTA